MKSIVTLSRLRTSIKPISLVISLVVAASIALPLGLTGCNGGPPNPAPESWHTGNFRFLDAVSDDLVKFVQGLEHPNQGGYGKVSSARKANFNALLDSLFAAIDASLKDGGSGDWCSVKSKATAAGYEIVRFYDTDSGRWFVHGRDTTAFGQAVFFINPFSKRNIVVEVPHEGFEADTGSEGARLFKALAARALIVNKEHRCSDPDQSPCATAATSVCNGSLRESDVAHHTANTFFLLHVRYSDIDPQTKFVQLHGFDSSPTDMVEICDGTNTDVASSSVSNIFAKSLRSSVPAPAAVRSCQEESGDPPSNLCGETNVEARYTHNPNASECPPAVSASSGRFLHVEQAKTLRDDDDSDGWFWGDVRDALLATWPDCNMNNGVTDCTLGPRQAQLDGLTCSTASTDGVRPLGHGPRDIDRGRLASGAHVWATLLHFNREWLVSDRG
ncbi:MAG TPA: hypothetical protein VFV34_00775 [Blastocatellia bacterium]|nr:hypothetical protein [Blastocatellia bacterium]